MYERAAPEHTTRVFHSKERKENHKQEGEEEDSIMAVNPNPPLSACWVIQPAVSPDAAVLTAHGCVLPGRFHVHVVQRGLPHHMMSPRELQALLRLPPQEEKKKYEFYIATW